MDRCRREQGARGSDGFLELRQPQTTERPSVQHTQVIVTSYLFPDGKFSLERLKAVSSAVGEDKLVVDVR